MQEAARQPISFKRNYSIADQSTQTAAGLVSKVIRDSNSRRNGSCPRHRLSGEFHISPCSPEQAGI